MHQVPSRRLATRSRTLVRLISRALTSAALLGAVIGCSEEPPSPVVRLEVSATGAYSLAGQPVASAELTKQLQALRSQTPRVELHVLADRSANYQFVGAAIAAAQAAQIAKLRVDTLHEEQK
ncbi:ExbD/TolR family protein [Paucibacter sp. DJ2R-2]|uniref:ExbD/TolR family protein n=1 Tax=Paucibacter sp. DJ2R-2 TaxID=2893558 RepID=UPI00398D40A4